MNQITQVTRNY